MATITSIARPELSANVREAQRVGLAAVHLTDGPLDVGETVEVAIDWDRRLDLVRILALISCNVRNELRACTDDATPRTASPLCRT